MDQDVSNVTRILIDERQIEHRRQLKKLKLNSTSEKNVAKGKLIALRDKQKDEQISLKNAQKEEIDSLKNEVDQSELEKRNQEHLDRLKALIERHDKEYNDLKSDVDKELEEIKISFDNDKLELLSSQKNEMSILENELTEKVAYLKTSQEKNINQLTDHINELQKKKALIKKQSEAELSEVKEKISDKKQFNIQSFRIKNRYNEAVKRIRNEINIHKKEIRKEKYRVYFATISKKTPTINAVLSGIIWGLGQVRNRQFVKGIIFFIIQVLFLLTEILTGKYLQYFSGAIKEFNIRDTGIFGRGIWGLVTLGTRKDVWKGPILIHGDRSNTLLITGLIAFLIFIIFLGVYILNIKDAYKTSKKQIKTQQVESTHEYVTELGEKSFELFVILPAFTLMLFFSIMPILFGLLVAFTNYAGKNTLLFEWVGFTNFAKLANFSKSGWGYTFLHVGKWTIIFAFFATITCFFGGLLQAIVLNNKRIVGRKIWRTIIILPWAIPQLVLLLVIQNVFNSQLGLVNTFLRDWGLMKQFAQWGWTNASGNIGWFDDANRPILAQSMVIFVNMFLGMPYYMALMTGIMTSIDKEMYEAADIDGANNRQKFWKITLPIVLYMTAPLLIMSFAFNLNNFGLIYFLTGGGPTNVNFEGTAGHTDILISWIYKLTTDPGMPLYNMASVFSIIIFIIIGSFSAWNFTKTKAFKEEDMV